MSHPQNIITKAEVIITSLALIFFNLSCNNFDFNQNKEQQSFGRIKDSLIQNIHLIKIPAGPFKKGLFCQSNLINYDYWIGKFEITNQQFFHFLEAALKNEFIFIKNNLLYYHYKGNSAVPKGDYRVRLWDDKINYRNDSLLLDTNFIQHPVVAVTWYGARAFCDFYGFDLPTEDEWEKAARGTHCTWFPWGNTINGSFANFHNSGDPFEPGTTPVGFYNGKTYKSFKTSDAASAYGCYDMAGNAWEWTSDFWDENTPYNKGKGGGFIYHSPAFLQVYYASSFGPHEAPALDMCNLSDGFRIVYKPYH